MSDRALGLLVTSAVVPHAPLTHPDQRLAATRLADYRAGLESWTFFERVGPIVVCDGSNFPEAEFRAAVTPPDGREGSFEYLAYPTTGDALQGKGRAEIELMARALDDSQSFVGVDRFLKVTGRYVIRNAEALVRRILAQPALPDVQVNLHNRLTLADSRVFLFSRDFFSRRVYPHRGEISDAEGTWMEHVLARATLAHVADGGDWDLLPLPLRARGIAGTTGTPHPETSLQYAQARARHWIKSRALGKR